MNNKREIFGWSMYDWANSAFSTSVATTFLGPYLLSLAETVNILGFPLDVETFFTFCVGASVFLQVLFLPILVKVKNLHSQKSEI